MKSIMMSIRPNWVAKILNGIKKKEVRKKFPVDYVGWVYIYCTKDKERLVKHRLANGGISYTLGKDFSYHNDDLNGKVVARFWCDKVEEIMETKQFSFTGYVVDKPYHTKTLTNEELQKESCIRNFELSIYLYTDDDYEYHKIGYAINITKLEIFDKPKEISEFMKTRCKGCSFENTQTCHNDIEGMLCRLTKAPQSWCYIEGE